jgi:hypothetical protein
MQAWLVRLMSIAAAFALSFVLVGIFLPGPGCNPGWAVARSKLHRLKSDVEWAEIGEPQLSVDEIDAWLSGRASKDVADRMVDIAENDPWGRPYRVVALAGESDERLGFYSVGRDGVSASGGNDPDDINSWTEATTRYYERESLFFSLLILLGLSAFLTPFVYTFAGMFAACLNALVARTPSHDKST